MYKFQIIANTRIEEFISIVGSTSELGIWDITKAVRLCTSVDRYPLWWTEKEIDFGVSLNSELAYGQKNQKIEYKYLLNNNHGNVQWESFGLNRWIPIEAEAHSSTIVVDDGAFDYLQPYPFGYFDFSVSRTVKPDFSAPAHWYSNVPTALRRSVPKIFLNKKAKGLKILILGSSVALGHKSWLLRGWSWLLGQTLELKYNHQVVNVSEVGANVRRTIARFPSIVAPERPDIVIIALSLGNEGLAYCPAWEQKVIQRRFESGLQELVKMVREIGAYPILGGVYPHNNYLPEHYWLLQETNNRMQSWDVPILNWLAALDNGEGHFKEGIFFDFAHPNTLGHRLMYETIDLKLFDLDQHKLAIIKQSTLKEQETLVYFDNFGFRVSTFVKDKLLRISNLSTHKYTINPDWQKLQIAIQQKAGLLPGLYLAKNVPIQIIPFLVVDEEGRIETMIDIPSRTEIEYKSIFDYFSPNKGLLFYDSHLGIFKEDEQHLWIINESDHEFNVHPMWQPVRKALKALPTGIYEDTFNPKIPFRTIIIGEDGLESRVKVPPKSALFFQYKCKLSDISRLSRLSSDNFFL